MDLTAAPSANSAAEKPPTQAVDKHGHSFLRLFHSHYLVRFQAQLFSDKSGDEHLGDFPFVLFW